MNKMFMLNHKRFSALALVLSLAMTAVLTALPVVADHSGLENEPDLIIRTANELISFAEKVLEGNNFKEKTIALGNDIVLTEPWNPIGDDTNPFNGTFDGKNHTIRGLTINTEKDCVGLFGVIGSWGKVCNLKLEKVSIIGGNYLGGIAGINDGIIKNCTVTGSITGKSWIGGIAGQYSGAIQKCLVTDASITSNSGGYDTASYLGGIAGSSNFLKGTPLIEECMFSGNVSDGDASSSYFGGIVGNANGEIKNCLAYGNVSSTSNIGGIIGSATMANLKNCIARNNISGTANTGGIAGASPSFSIANCAALCSAITGDTDVGRIAGQLWATSLLSGNFALNSIAGSWTDDVAGKDGATKTQGELKDPTAWSTFLSEKDAQGNDIWVWLDNAWHPVLAIAPYGDFNQPSEDSSSSPTQNAANTPETLAALNQLGQGGEPPKGAVTQNGRAVLPVNLNSGSAALGLELMNTLGGLPSGVGLQANIDGGAATITLPGGFGSVREPGRIYYPLDFVTPAPDEAAMLKAGSNPKQYQTFKLGANFALPGTGTVSVKTKLPEGATVYVYRYDSAGKLILIATAKVQDGRVQFDTAQLGQFIGTTSKI